MMWWMMGDGFPMWGMVVGFLTFLLFWGAIIFLIVWVVRTLVKGREESHSNGPLFILKERYARGEITREQYQQMMQDLQEERQERIAFR
jgi:putative membrane protein